MTAITTHTTSTDKYDDTGNGEPALLCLPGWCGDRGVFNALVGGLAEHRRVIQMDLPEHGARPRTGADFTTEDVVVDAITTLNDCHVDRVVPVALSHAGWAAIELRRRLGPQRVPGIVLLDWMVLGAPPAFLDALSGLQDAATWSRVRAGLFSMWTTGLDVPELHAYVARMGEYGAGHWRNAGREIAAAFTAEGTPAAALEALPEPCPTMHLYAQPADDAVLAAQQGYAETHPWFRVHRLAASSHFPMFEVPGEMVDVIEDFACTLR